MEMRSVWVVAVRELREALHNRWLLIYTFGFTILAFMLARASLVSAGYAGLGGFGRTAASLVNALLLFVPLLGLSVGAGALAGDRERGTLIYLLAMPVSRAEVFFGKILGSGLAVAAALGVGFGMAALVLSLGAGGDVTAYLGLVGFTALLALACLGLGFLISAWTRKSSAATGAALLTWLALAFLGDLGVVGATLALRPTPARLMGMLVVNPLQTFKLGAIYSLNSTMDVLGAVGQYAVYRFGSALPLLLAGLLLAWVVVAFSMAYLVFSRGRYV